MADRCYKVGGMTCAACAARVDKAIRRVDGIKDVSVNFASGMVRVSGDNLMDMDSMVGRAVRDAGYELVTSDASDVLSKSRLKGRRDFVQSLCLSIPLMALSILGKTVPYSGYAQMILAALTIAFPGRRIFVSAFKGLRHFTADMNTLVAMSVGVSFIFSVCALVFPQMFQAISSHLYFDASGMVITFVLLGKMLEGMATAKTTSAIRKLMELRPKVATVVSEEGFQTVRVEDLKVGDILLLKPGERVPVDGVVLSGDSFIDESSVTGEPFPVRRKNGDSVLSGTVNTGGVLQFRAEKVGEDTMISKIISLVAAAQDSKAPVQRLVDRIAAVFVPLVVVLAIVSAVIWLLSGAKDSAMHALMAFVNIMVIACPCAMGLAAPTAIMVGVGSSASHGILVRNASALEKAAHIGAIVLDKTGTLTQGSPSMTDIRWKDADSSIWEGVFASMESLSEHPLAKAIVSALKPSREEVSDVKAFHGMGISCRLSSQVFWAGNAKMMEMIGSAADEVLVAYARGLEAQARTVVLFGNDREVLAVAGISDSIRQGACEAVSAIRDMGVDVVMLTGDSEGAAAYVAGKCGIQTWRSSLLPQQKADFVTSLQRSGVKVAFAGDGINDSAALAVADLSIAMGRGSDLAKEIADMTIVSSDLRKIPQAVKISAMTLKTLKTNLLWAFLYNILAIPIAAGVLFPLWGITLNPMVASAAMAMSSVSVVTASLLLGLRIRRMKLLNNDKNDKVMIERDYEITGMMCGNCRRHVENALNSIPGVSAQVTLPSHAKITFTAGELPLQRLQQALSEEGDYFIKTK